MVIDGSIPHPDLGVITGEPIRMEVEDGLVCHITGGEQAEALKRLLASYNDGRVWEMGEIGIGLNEAGILSGRMLEDEGCHHTLHVAIGSGSSRAVFKRNNKCPFHLDMLMKNPTVEVDGRVIVKDGEPVC